MASKEVQQAAQGRGEVVHGILAGAASGLVARAIGFPADTVKARMQVRGAVHTRSANGASASARTTIGATLQLYRQEGVRGFFRGFSAVMAGAVPAQATYFAAYEFGRSIVPKDSGVAGDMATGAIAQLIAGVVFTPVDIVKERLQTKTLLEPSQRGAKGVNAVSVFASVIRESGPLGLFRGYWATNCVWMPWNIIYISLYHDLQRRIRKHQELAADAPLHPVALSAAAFTAASTAVIVTHPPDVVKTRMQVLPGDRSALTFMSVARQLLRSEGLRGLWGGVTARTLTIGPGAAFSWLLYEQLKQVLNACGF